MPDWTFITNHGAVLANIARHGKVKAVDISSELGITERSVRRIIADLVADGYIYKKREGGVNRYQVNPDMPLRRREMQHIRIKDLIRGALIKG
jgi:DeoR/GlpR family transcriptional regulator of sugar metabolism